MHLHRKYDVTPPRSAMMQCLPNVPSGTHHSRSEHHWRSLASFAEGKHHSKKPNLSGRQIRLFCCLKRVKRCLSEVKTNKRCLFGVINHQRSCYVLSQYVIYQLIPLNNSSGLSNNRMISTLHVLCILVLYCHNID